MKIIWPPPLFWPYAGIALLSLAVMIRERSDTGAVAFGCIVFILTMLKLREINEKGKNREKPKPAFGSTERKP